MKAPRDQGIENDTRSIPRTSSRSSGRMRSTESGTAALELGLGGPEIDRHEIGRRNRIADREARVSESTDRRRRGSTPRWSDPPRIRRMDLVRGVAEDDHRDRKSVV